MSIGQIAMGLFLASLIAIGFVGYVLQLQIKLMRLRVPTSYVKFRRSMFALSTTILLGNFVPSIIYFYYAFINRPDGADAMLVFYAVTNTIISVASAIAIWTIYRIAFKEIKKG
jgi:hypothetical protein